MACGGCARRRAAMKKERDRREAKGEKVVPALIDGALAVVDAVAKPLTKKEAKR